MTHVPTPVPTPIAVPVPKLPPTPMSVPVVIGFMAVDFLRAHGIDEHAISTIQNGFGLGLVDRVHVRGKNVYGIIVAEAVFGTDDFRPDTTVMVDPSSADSVTAQMSRRFERGIVHTVQLMRSRGLSIDYTYYFTALGNVNGDATRSRLGLVDVQEEQRDPTMRQHFRISHGPTGAYLSYAST